METDMGEIARNLEQEFWRPHITRGAEAPATVVIADSAVSEACRKCKAEFVMGSHYCHVCGTSRGDAGLLSKTGASGLLGLSTPSFVAFTIGVGCLLAALLVGMVLADEGVENWQVVQICRIEWLLGAAAAFVAGILLKRPR